MKPLLILLIAFGLAACDLPIDLPDYREMQTQIRDIRVVPNPVAAGDTATITVVIEDSVNISAYKFTWTMLGPPVMGEGPHVRWVAPQIPKVYHGSVNVDNGLAYKDPASSEFSITVIRNPK